MINIIFLCIAGFIAAFVDSIAGGGGLISIPAFLFAGVPPHIALGTNKFAATTSSFTSSMKFITSKKVNFSLLKYLIPFTFLGSILGVKSVLLVDQSFLYPLVMVLVLFVGIYTLFSKTLGLNNNFTGLNKKNIALGILLSFSIGFYDGFFGPGTGSFLIFGLISIFKFDFINAGGNGKVLNFVSNISALIMFALNGKIDYFYGILVAVFMIAGAQLGTKAALTNGAKLIKPIFVTMSLAVAIKLLIQYV
ncbi:TSUP family transporter [Clostridium hydrogeniformans]|uniref:TSUP family transporter n=1 Tax=Clostridium hydrogeniformans TaxID=349933 RepID=UPI00047FDF32|nr:TSUP family transporter [Clostridium hydrogeniformans]